MRPYWAIIKDSFRAALASRVLYVLLLLITILLAALAPFHVKEVLDWKIKLGQHIPNPESLVRRLVENQDNVDRPEIRQIWDRLPSGLQGELTAIANDEDPDAKPETRTPGSSHRINRYEELIKQLNEMVKDRTFYQSELWEGRPLKTETEELIEAGPDSLSEDRSRRLNRLLIGEALTPEVQSGSSTALDCYYGVWKWEFLSTNQTQSQFAAQVADVIPALFDKFVLSIGLLIAILVTANIIPETFDPGSLNLLLSKPVSRWALFLAKFFGGCAFVALCAVYLFLGTWLWLGIGLGVWDRAFLLSIPLYIIVFAIYYSVSALVGLTYRSGTMAIIVTGLFWAICFSVGSGYGFLNTRMENVQLMEISPVGDDVLCVDGVGRLVAWDSGDNQWEQTAKAALKQEEELGLNIAMWVGKLREEPTRLPPILDANSNTILVGVAPAIQPLARGHQEFYLSPANEIDFRSAGKFPRDAIAMFAAKQGPIVVNASGKFLQLSSADLENLLKSTGKQTGADSVNQASKETATRLQEPDGTDQQLNDSGTADLEDDSGDSKETDDPSTTGASRPTMQTKNAETLFKRIGPKKSVSVRRKTSLAFNHLTEEIAAFDRSKITVFQRDEDGEYRQDRSLEIDTDTSQSMTGYLGFAGNTILLVLGNGQVITVDAEKMVEKKGYLPETRFGIEQVAGSNDGRWFALLYRNQKVWVLDTQNDDQIRLANVSGQGDISSVGFDGQSRLWVVDRTDRATRYELESASRDEVLTPGGSWIDWAYRYAVRPFYRVCPKPSEFYKVVTYLSDTTDTSSNQDVDLTRVQPTGDPWSPLTSGLGFMAVILLLSCTIFHFKDY